VKAILKYSHCLCQTTTLDFKADKTHYRGQNIAIDEAVKRSDPIPRRIQGKAQERFH
jgi:hypothetical protein